jgi:hypothetical protein
MASPQGQDLVRLRADRRAIERVYYAHRLGAKPPFEEFINPERIRELVEQDLIKEKLLRSHYAIEITPQMLKSEVERINSGSRAPEMLNELKAALDNDPARFASTVAKPLVVDRLLREHFESDDALHSSQRQTAEDVRQRVRDAHRLDRPISELVAVLKQAKGGQISQLAFRLTPLQPKPARAEPSLAPFADSSGAPANGSPTEQRSEEMSLDVLPERLQDLLRAQLLKPGDISALVEFPDSFKLYLLTERNVNRLEVAVLSISKQSYQQWLLSQRQP